jgi:hypothetical protein
MADDLRGRRVDVTSELRGILVDLFLTASQAIARRLQAAGLPLTVKVTRTVVERPEPASWQLESRDETRNILASGRAGLPAPSLAQREIDTANRCGVMLAKAARETLPFFAPFSSKTWPLIEQSGSGSAVPDYRHDPGGWTTLHIVLPALRQRLEGLPRLDHADAAAAGAFADEVLRVAHDDQLRYRILVPLSGLDLDVAEGDAISRGHASLRRLSAAEQGEWFEYDERQSVWSLVDMEPPQVLLELHVSGPRAAQEILSRNQASAVVAAFQVHGFPVAGRLAAEYSDPAWVVPAVLRFPLTLPGHAKSESAITSRDFSGVLATANLLAGYNLAQPDSPKDLALHRFVAGLARQNDADAVLDFAIVLEALLLPYDENARRGDIGYRFRVHGAHYLAEDPAQRYGLAKQLSDLYDLRSRLVHGRQYPAPDQIAFTRDSARDLARRGLLRALYEGFPTAEEFNRMVLNLPDLPALGDADPRHQP